MKNILFVCTGNTCRSPMAEAIMAKLLKDMGKKLQGIQVKSAGTTAMPGQDPAINAVQAMKEKNIDMAGYQSTPLTKELIKESDMILTMTRRHKQQVLMIDPEAADKTYVLKEYASNLTKDISDPFGQSLDVYRQCAIELENELKQLLIKLDGDLEK